MRGSEGALFAQRVIEEREAEHQPALLVDGDKAPVPDAPDKMQQAGVLAAPLGGIVGGRSRVRPLLPLRRRHIVVWEPFSMRLQSSVNG